MKKTGMAFWALVVSVSFVLLLPAILSCVLYFWGVCNIPSDLVPPDPQEYNEKVLEFCWLSHGGRGEPKVEPIEMVHVYYAMWKRMFSDRPILSFETSGGSILNRGGECILENHPELRRIPRIPRYLLRTVFGVWLSRNWSADQILTYILDSEYAGLGKSGFKNASRMYFGKDSSELTLPEMALVTDLPSDQSEPWCDAQRAVEHANSILERYNRFQKTEDRVPLLDRLPESLLPAPEGACQPGSSLPGNPDPPR